MHPTREQLRNRIEVHVAGVCLRLNNGKWQLLAGKRTEERSLYPGRWECGGGQVRRGEDFQTAVRRQIWEEFGIAVEPQYPIEDYRIPLPAGGVIPGLRWLCLAKEGEVRLDRREFSEHRWLDLPVSNLDWIPGLKETLDEHLARFLAAQPKPPAKQPVGFHGGEKAS